MTLKRDSISNLLLRNANAPHLLCTTCCEGMVEPPPDPPDPLPGCTTWPSQVTAWIINTNSLDVDCQVPYSGHSRKIVPSFYWSMNGMYLLDINIDTSTFKLWLGVADSLFATRYVYNTEDCSGTPTLTYCLRVRVMAYALATPIWKVGVNFKTLWYGDPDDDPEVDDPVGTMDPFNSEDIPDGGCIYQLGGENTEEESSWKLWEGYSVIYEGDWT